MTTRCWPQAESAHARKSQSNLCSLQSEALHLNEHEAAKWLLMDELGSVKWLPADLEVVEVLKRVKGK